LKYLIVTFIITVLLGTTNVSAQQISLSVSGTWRLTISASDVSSGAGSDVNSTYTSNTDQIDVDVDKVVYGNFWDWFISYNWRVDVSRNDINWNSNMELWARRSSDGFGFGSIGGGSTYRRITGSASTFFWGNGRRFWTNVQYQLRGMSVTVPPGNYRTVVVYTVIEI